MIKYRTANWSFSLEIEPVEVERETEKCVWITYRTGRSRRNLKHQSLGYHYFDTFMDAKDWLMKQAKDGLMRANHRIDDLPALYEEVKAKAQKDLVKAQKRVSDVEGLNELS